jgi:hypothetical protein
MKRQWTAEDLAEHWTLSPDDRALLANRAPATRLGFALLLKYFQHEGRFPPHKRDVPTAAIVHVARQLDLPPERYTQYDWDSRTIEFHRAQVRQALGFRTATTRDAADLARWLQHEVLPHEYRPERLQAAVCARCRACHIEPPAPGRVDRLIHSAARAYEDQLYRAVLGRIGPEGLAHIDALLAPDNTPEQEEPTAEDAPSDRLTLHDLKADPGRLRLDNVFAQIDRLRQVREVALPDDLFTGVSPQVVHRYRQRAAAEPPSELRAHPDAVRAMLVAALCLPRQQEITDGLLDLLIAMVHKIGATAERRVEREFLADLKRVTGKPTILYHVAEAAVEHPDGLVREVIYPAAGGEQTLRDLVREYKATGPAYRLRVQTHQRASYRSHYRRVLPQLLDVLTFRSNNAAHAPVIQALDLLRRYSPDKARRFPLHEDVPLDGVVPAGALDTVICTDANGRPRIDRINYELCVLQTLRDKVRCKEVWVEGADRYRNPDEDLPADFAAQRTAYYESLHLPLDSATFVRGVQDELAAALTALDRAMPRNRGVAILPKHHG